MLVPLEKYFEVAGRASRAELWSFALLQLAFFAFFALLGGGMEVAIGEGAGFAAAVVMIGLLSLALLVPNVTVAVRRLHDIGKSGWWYLIQMVPMIGGIVFLVFMLMPSQPGSNQYGPNPYGK